MAIAEKDIKLLWGRAAGCCSKPDCHADLTPLLEKSGAIVIGEMAHVIGRKKGAARHDADVGEDDSYANLILLCPTHHTLVDKAEGDFPQELLHQWKTDWEAEVAGISIRIETRVQLFDEIGRLLLENHLVHSEWGPTSKRANNTPQSCQPATTWQLRRLGVIVPNNRRVVKLLRANKTMLSQAEWSVAITFIEHAEFFERHCTDPVDETGYLPFPKAFSEFVKRELDDVQHE